MKTLVLAGGTGTRLWPVSRIYNPKQFTKFKGMGNSTFQMTMEKTSSICDVNDIFIVTNREYKYFVSGQLNESGVAVPHENIILEPYFKSTLHAVASGVREIEKRFGKDEPVLVIPSNGLVTNYEELFRNIGLETEAKTDHNYIYAFGLDSSGEYVGYGYIEKGRECPLGFFAKSFKALPADGVPKENIFYHSGVIYFTVGTFMAEIKKHMGYFYDLLTNGSLDEVYDTEMSDTIERGVLEKSDNIVVIPLGKPWFGINEFSSFYEQYDEKYDEYNNITFNDNVFLESENNLVYSEDNKIVGLVGVKDLIVIDQPDALLVCRNDMTHRVRDVATILKKRGDSRAEYHTTCYRPWGSYTVLEEGFAYKLKRITVQSEKKLSYQMHYQRSEHWVVVSGTAKVTIDDKEYIVKAGESIFISIGQKHRLENPTKSPLEVIEVQIGGYLGEDDIVRFEDEYGRG